MATLQSPPGTIYNCSPGRPSPGEVVQIPDVVRARCACGADTPPYSKMSCLWNFHLELTIPAECSVVMKHLDLRTKGHHSKPWGPQFIATAPRLLSFEAAAIGFPTHSFLQPNDDPSWSQGPVGVFRVTHAPHICIPPWLQWH